MSPTRGRALAACVAAIGLTVCTGRNPVEPIPTPTTPVVEASQPPAPAPPSSPPEPTPEPPQPPRNHPPTVTLTGGGSCHPRPDKPCWVEFQADPHDRDGDPVTLEWRGCTSGTGFTERCTIDRPGQFTALVIVKDSHGATARETGTADGTNLPPVVKLGPYGFPPDPAPSDRVYTIVGGEPHDPDDYMNQNSACPHARASATGPCRATLASCGGVGDVFDIDVRTLTGPGTCVVEATVTDPWGAVGRDTYTFHVLAP